MKRADRSYQTLRGLKLTVFILLSLVLLAACAKKQDEAAFIRLEQSQQDFFELQNDVQLPDRPVVLSDLIAFALNRNLDVLALQQEYEIQKETATGEKLALLPSIKFNGEFSQRSNTAASTSRSLLTGLESISSSTSSELKTEKRDLSVVWGLLDFGLSYYRARQEKNRALIIKERHTRLRQNLILDVIQAYWKAIIAQKAVDGAVSIVDMAKERQKNLQKQIEQQTISEIEGLENEERLIEMQIRLQTFQNDLFSAKAELASLLGLLPGTDFALDEIETVGLEKLTLDVEELEETALVNRPELFIQDLEEKVNADEIRATMLSYFPNPSLFGTYNYDRNHFLINKTWMNMGLRAVWDLLSFPRYRQSQKVAERKLSNLEKARKSLSIGILTQVRLAYLTHKNSLRQYQLAKDLYSIKTRLYDAVKKGEQLGEYGGSEILRLQAESLFSKINSLTSYAEMHISLERINNAIGKPLFYSYLNLEEIQNSRLGLKDESEEEIIEQVAEETESKKDAEEEAPNVAEEAKEEQLEEETVSEEEAKEQEGQELEEAEAEELEQKDREEADEQLEKGVGSGYTADEELLIDDEENVSPSADEELNEEDLKTIQESREKKQQQEEEPRRIKKMIKLIVDEKREALDKRIEIISNRIFKEMDEKKQEQKQSLASVFEKIYIKLPFVPSLIKEPYYKEKVVDKLSKEQILELVGPDMADPILDDEMIASILDEKPAQESKEQAIASLEEDFSDESVNDLLIKKIFKERAYRRELAQIQRNIEEEQDRLLSLLIEQEDQKEDEQIGFFERIRQIFFEKELVEETEEQNIEEENIAKKPLEATKRPLSRNIERDFSEQLLEDMADEVFDDSVLVKKLAKERLEEKVQAPKSQKTLLTDVLREDLADEELPEIHDVSRIAERTFEQSIEDQRIRAVSTRILEQLFKIAENHAQEIGPLSSNYNEERFEFGRIKENAKQELHSRAENSFENRLDQTQEDKRRVQISELAEKAFEKLLRGLNEAPRHLGYGERSFENRVAHKKAIPTLPIFSQVAEENFRQRALFLAKEETSSIKPVLSPLAEAQFFEKSYFKAKPAPISIQPVLSPLAEAEFFEMSQFTAKDAPSSIQPVLSPLAEAQFFEMSQFTAKDAPGSIQPVLSPLAETQFFEMSQFTAKDAPGSIQPVLSPLAEAQFFEMSQFTAKEVPSSIRPIISELAETTFFNRTEIKTKETKRSRSVSLVAEELFRERSYFEAKEVLSIQPVSSKLAEILFEELSKEAKKAAAPKGLKVLRSKIAEKQFEQNLREPNTSNQALRNVSIREKTEELFEERVEERALERIKTRVSQTAELRFENLLPQKTELLDQEHTENAEKEHVAVISSDLSEINFENRKKPLDKIEQKISRKVRIGAALFEERIATQINQEASKQTKLTLKRPHEFAENLFERRVFIKKASEESIVAMHRKLSDLAEKNFEAHVFQKNHISILRNRKDTEAIANFEKRFEERTSTTTELSVPLKISLYAEENFEEKLTKIHREENSIRPLVAKGEDLFKQRALKPIVKSNPFLDSLKALFSKDPKAKAEKRALRINEIAIQRFEQRLIEMNRDRQNSQIGARGLEQFLQEKKERESYKKRLSQ